MDVLFKTGNLRLPIWNFAVLGRDPDNTVDEPIIGISDLKKLIKIKNKNTHNMIIICGLRLKMKVA